MDSRRYRTDALIRDVSGASSLLVRERFGLETANQHGTNVAQRYKHADEVRLCRCWVVIRPLTTRHTSPERERLFQPSRVSDEGARGETGPLIFYAGRVGGGP